MPKNVKYYEIRSGRPAGEVYDHVVWVALDEAAKTAAEQDVQDNIESLPEWRKENWLWGPHTHEREGKPSDALHWDGHNEVPAPVWK